MKLTLQGLEAKTGWESYRLPTYDIAAVRGRTAKHPTWLHFGAGSIFRAYPAMLVQRLLTAGLMDTGIIVCESYDEELIDRVYRGYVVDYIHVKAINFAVFNLADVCVTLGTLALAAWVIYGELRRSREGKAEAAGGKS